MSYHVLSHIISKGIIESLQSYLDEARMRDWGFFPWKD
ncbi:hypothetical protein LEP1GSC133_3568 [Leptospira borgpetersenii serovar Pomona str. 200901868]|uniref:Uncharacterized protein n=1 Tax=Leptospira borgpetersenii serovar Pomona str. 200901868 TaxID=1192866 RepID=M6W6D9_LEPBO|nr:hypothetical protein LEP1GSC133_3568 [Leptospira borgpetersenii serovar Pomona str. 200901868]